MLKAFTTSSVQLDADQSTGEKFCLTGSNVVSGFYYAQAFFAKTCLIKNSFWVFYYWVVMLAGID